ncbi:MAG TPA: hypothetical protein VKY39_06090 [Aggregatilineales bacterium]|nr:hypothetical protein [Aggregatilineales bacterium]
MSRRTTALIGIILSVVLLAGALGLLYTAYRRVEIPLRLTGNSWVTGGVVTEKLVERRPDRLLPFDVETHVVRYAFPNAEGQMRTGEQVVTRRLYRALPGQGGPLPVVVHGDDPDVHAINPGLAFPASAGWRAGMGMAALVAAIVLSTISTALARPPAEE